MSNPSDNERIFTLRAFLVGSACAFAVSAGSAYGAYYLHGSFMAIGTSMPGAIFILFILTLLINPLLKIIYPRAGLSRQELLLVFIMMIMASPMPQLFVWRFLCSLTFPFYYHTPQNGWRELIHPFIPDWMMPHNPHFARLFYEGAGQGEAIPWDVWMPVFLAWMPFIWAMFLVMIATMVILRRQWVENERLIYPLMQLPLAMIGEEKEDGGRLGAFFKNPVMWAGFAVPGLYGTLHGLYNYFPELIPVAKHVDPFNADIPIFGNVHDLYILLRFNILGFFYFLKTEIAFSIWFFNLLSYVVRGVFGILGIGITEAGMPASEDSGHAVPNLILAYQSMGGMLVLFLGGWWMARGHLKAVFRKAFTGDPEVDDSDEILSYRMAVSIVIVGSLVMLGWLWYAGLPLLIGVVLLFLTATILVGYSRIVAEGGLSDGSPPVVPAGIMASALGSVNIGAPGLAVLGVCLWWTEGRNFVMVSAAQALRMGELGGNQSKRPLFWAMVAAVAIALVGAMWMIMQLSHEFGAINLSWIYIGGYGFVESLMRSPTGPRLETWAHMGIGGMIMTGLMVGRSLFQWWPLHPLGYVVGPIWILDHLWFNMFLAWLIKVIVLKYGGVKLYTRTRPFFMGMILGYFTPGGLFLIVDHFTGMNGNIIFWG